MLNFDTIAHAAAKVEPFPYFAVSDVLETDAVDKISHDFPDINQPGIFALSDVECKGAFQKLIEDIRSPQLQEIMEDKFGIDLRDKPLMITVRGFCQEKDGRIHSDSKDKLVTCLLYLNDPTWNEQGGRLRLLRNKNDINSTITEVSPRGGNFVAFKRTDISWHGHEPFIGRRRYIMFNWLRSDAALAKNVGRHKLSAIFKRWGLFDGY